MVLIVVGRRVFILLMYYTIDYVDTNHNFTQNLITVLFTNPESSTILDTTHGS